MALDGRLGRWRFLTITNDVTETVGDQLEAIGGGVVPGTRRPRPLRLQIPVHGAGSADPYEEGLKMRRQARSLLENAVARLEGLYFRFAHDPELNAWMVIGTGSLKYDSGGITLADFALELEDAFKVANRRTHREARRVEVYDRRLSTTPRDILRGVFSTDFASWSPSAYPAFPNGSTAVVSGATRGVVVVSPRLFAGGAVYVATGLVHGDVCHFERDEDDMHALDDVVVHDSRGNPDPVASDAALILAARPVVLYRLNEEQDATTAKDSSGNQLDGEYQGTPLYHGTSPMGNGDWSAGFSEADGAYMRVPDDPLLDITGDLSVAGWVRPKNTTDQVAVVSKDSGSAGSRGWRFSWVGATNQLRFEASADGTAVTTANSTSSAGLATDVWAHVAMVYEAAAGKVTFYVNGVQVGASVTGLPTSLFVNTRRLTVGKLAADA